MADVLEQPVDVRPSGWRRQPPLPTFDHLMTIPKEMAIPKGLRIAGVEAFPIRLAPAGADSGRGPSRRDMQPQDVGQDYFISSEGWRSIYSRRHKTCLVRIEDDTGKIGWGEGQAPVSPRTVASRRRAAAPYASRSSSGGHGISVVSHVLRHAQELGARWLEAPTLAEDVHGHTQVAAALDLQVATGEWLRTAWE